jgi:hypothetical protein
MAKQLYGEKRFDAIKVVKDDFDPKTNKGKEMVIYDSAKPQAEKKAPPTKEEAKPAAAPDKKADVDFHGHGKSAAKKSENSLVKAILWLVVLLVGGLVALYGLAQLGGFLGKL